MAIAYDNSAAANYQASGTLSSSYTMSAGSNGVLFVWNESGGGGDPTSMTFNGVSLTKVIAGVTADGISLWMLISPASGSHTLTVISLSQIFYSIMSYTGAKQSYTLDNSGSASGSSTSAHNTLTPVASNCWMISYIQDDATSSFTPTGTIVQRSGTGPFGDMCMVDSNGTVSGSTTQAVTVDNGAWFMVSFTLAPPGAPAGPNSNFLAFM